MRLCDRRCFAPFVATSRAWLLCALAASALVGCGADAGSGPPPEVDAAEAAADMGSAYPAPFPAPPQVATQGGPVLVAPRVVPVFFANSNPNYKTQIIDFEKRLGSTEYWKATTEEYGVGPMTVTAPANVAESPTGKITNLAVEAWLTSKLNSDDAAFPEPDTNVLYVLHYPAELTITQEGFFGVGTSCVDFGGYHGNVQLDFVHGRLLVAYAVIPDCGSFGEQMGLDAITATESHELVEAATDPYPKDDPAYSNTDADHAFWGFALGGGENGDLCAQDPASFVRFPELKYVVQRSWSNKAATAGKDPCVPAIDKAVYFNTAPELPETITIGGGGQTFSMLGVSIPVGTSKTVPLRLYSEADTGADWKVSAKDVTIFSGGVSTMAFTFDKTTGRNGDVINLTIKSTKASQFGASAFMLTSKLGNTSHISFGLVGQ